MTPTIIGVVLGAALLHAAWNATLRSGADRLWSIVAMSLASAVVSLPFALAMGAPAEGSWPYLALSAVLQTGYFLFLARAYREGDFGQIYPIARGSSPLLVTLGAVVFAGERLTLFSLTSVIAISVGIMALAWGRDRPRAGSVAAALATGAFIAAYTVTDGLGARLSGDSVSYAAWLFVLKGAPMGLLFLAWRRRFPAAVLTRETAKAAGGGIVSLVAYSLVLWALTLSPMGQVSALRETSVVFAVLIGLVFLKERLTWGRAAAVSLIAAGAVCLSLAAT